MKNLLLVALMLFSTVTLADSTDVQSFLIDGSRSFEEVNLSTEKTRTEYRTVRLPSTCYRTETRRECRRERVCDRNGNCRAVQRCRPVTRRVPYRCMRTVTRPVQVHDYYVETNVRFDIALPAAQELVREEVRMAMTGDRAKLSVNGSKNYFVMLDAQNRTESRDAGVKYVNLTYKVRLVSAAQAKMALSNGIQNVKLRSGVLTFTLGEGFNLSNFSQQIRIFKNRRLGSDTLLLDKYLSNNEADLQSTASGTNITVNLRNLGINLPSKMRVILDTRFNIDENKILNRGEIDVTKSANWVFR